VQYTKVRIPVGGLPGSARTEKRANPRSRFRVRESYIKSVPMKLIKKQISAKDGSGLVLLRPDTAEDLWHAYNLLQVGDLVRCTTSRKVIKEGSTGSTTSSIKRLMLTVVIQKVDFDVDVQQVRLSGTVHSENDHVRMGAYHTLTLELNQNFSIEKHCWDQVFLDLLDEAIHPERAAEIAAIVMQLGLAHICLVTGALNITKARIETNIPKKRIGSSNHRTAVNKFFEAVYQAALRHLNFTQVKCVLLGSPGFVKDDLFKYIKEQMVRREDRPFIENISKFVLCKASSGHKHALDEMFSEPSITSQLATTKVAKEVATLDQFMRMLSTDPDRAYYGYDHVAAAQEHHAIESLLVTDELFRNSNVMERKKYVQLVENVRAYGGHVHIFSSMHVSGQQLQQVSGVAAILRYPLPNLDDLDEIDTMQVEGISLLDSAREDTTESDRNKRMHEDIADMGLG
jgi:protein pelota